MTDATQPVRNHYEQLLAASYSWMCGDFEERVSLAKNFFGSHCVPAENKRAIDLGCGSGIQTIALARLGYSVTAVDFSIHLLKEVADRSDGLEVNTKIYCCHTVPQPGQSNRLNTGSTSEINSSLVLSRNTMRTKEIFYQAYTLLKITTHP